MSPTTRSQSPLRTGLAVFSGLVLGAGGLAFGFLLTFLAAAVLVTGLGVELTPASTIVLSLVFVQGVGCLGVALVYRRVRPSIARFVGERVSWLGSREAFDIGAAVPSLKQVAVVVVGYVLAFVGGPVVGGFVRSQLAVDTGTNSAVEVATGAPSVLLVLIPASVLLIGPGEELLFRGVVQGRLREVMGPAPAVGLASIIFASLHWFALTGGSTAGNALVVAILTVPAVVFGAAYEYTGNVVVPALIHGLYNATLFTLLYAVLRFGPDAAGPGAGVLTLVGL
ncbi:MAG: lysostaphin resistance A-like protein [Halolamina sp.]